MAAAFLVMRFLLFFWLTDVTCSSALIGETFQLKEQNDPSKSLDHYQQRGPFPVKWSPRAQFSNFPIFSQSNGKICSDMKLCGTGRYVIQSRIIPSEFDERKVIYGPKHGPKPSFMFYASFPIPHQLTAKGSNVLYHHGLHHPPHPPKQYCPGSHHPHSQTHCPGPHHYPPKHPGPGLHHVHQGIHNLHEPKHPGPGPHKVQQGIHYPYQPKLPGLGPHHVHQGNHKPYQPKLPGLGPHHVHQGNHEPYQPKLPGLGPHHVHQGDHEPYQPKLPGLGPHHVHQGDHEPYQPKLAGLGPHLTRHCPLHGPCPEPHKHRRPYSAKLDMSRVMHNMFGHRNQGRQIKPDELSIHQTDKQNLGSKGHNTIKD